MGRITPEADGTIDPVKSDQDWARNTDTPRVGTQQRAPQSKVAESADLPGSPPTGGTSLLQARTVNEVVKAQTNKVRLAQLKGELVENVVDTLRDPLLVLDGGLQVVSANRAFYQYFQVMAADTVGRKVYDLGNSQWNIPALRELLEVILPRDRAVEVEHDFPAIGHRKIKLNARRIVGKISEPSLILLTTEEIIEQSTEGNNA